MKFQDLLLSLAVRGNHTLARGQYSQLLIDEQIMAFANLLSRHLYKWSKIESSKSHKVLKGCSG